MNPLDNIIWHALNTRHAQFAQGDAQVKKFLPKVAPFSAFPEADNDDYSGLAKIIPHGGVTALFTREDYKPRQGWEAVAGGPLIQMVREVKGETGLMPPSSAIETLGAGQSAEMIELVQIAKPGPFSSRTHEMGDYFGLREGGKLVALSGDRLKVPGYTEVSAVCTHPDHLGKGYAGTLMSRVIRGIEARGETALLHSRADNDRAIALYERLGFRTRLNGYFIVLKRE
jgi:ribosomal protein S18 acetylase RimI-like enzyme